MKLSTFNQKFIKQSSIRNSIFLSMISLIVIFTFNNCDSSTKKTGPFVFFEQLEGSWQNSSQNQIERWYFDKGAPRATSYKITNLNDTIVTERIKIIKQQDKLYFVAILFNQKNEAPVRFKRTEETENSITFENKEHDFPQKIVYRIVTTDSLVASISGLIDGFEKNIDFPYKRIK